MVTPAFFINNTGVIGVVISSMTNNVTGSLFLTLLYIMIVLVALCLGAGLPIEWTLIIMLPLLIVTMAYSSDFLSVGGFALMYLGIIFAKNWFANR